jgi:hypothetical protein
MPSWRSWKKLVELYACFCQYEFTTRDITRIDDLVVQHSQLFDKVGVYAGLKRPKHHFATHIAGDIYKYGPPRGYWTFGFESLNRVIKAAARKSNWRRDSYDIMKFWSMRSARWLRESER